MSKRNYQQKLQDQLGHWQTKIDQLTARMKQAGTGTRREVEHQIADLRAKQKAARRKLEQLERSGRSVRHGAGVDAARRKVHKVIQRITSGFR